MEFRFDTKRFFNKKESSYHARKHSKMAYLQNRSGTGNSGRGGGKSQYEAQTEAQRIAQEFARIDTNGDGRVDRQEMDAFLAQSGIDDDHRS